MEQTRRERLRDNMREEIKGIARKQMQENGTAAIGLRAVARELGVTAPAIYRYFPSLDDLITALIVDAFNSLASALEDARDSHLNESHLTQLKAVFTAYRAWALQYPADFQLIYGNPIPGYHARREVTVPAVIRGFAVIVGLIEQLINSGIWIPKPPYDQIPSGIVPQIHAIVQRDQYPVSELSLYLGIKCWTRHHSTIMLELFNHLQPVVGKVDVYFEDEINAMLRDMGVNM